MSQLPLTCTAYATVPPSGDKLGEVSSPAASVIRVKKSQRGSAAGVRLFNSQGTAAATTANAAIVHGSHAARAGRADGAARSTAAAEDVDRVDSVSRANARSLAD